MIGTPTNKEALIDYLVNQIASLVRELGVRTIERDQANAQLSVLNGEKLAQHSAKLGNLPTKSVDVNGPIDFNGTRSQT